MASLEARVLRHLAELGVGARPARVVVGVSGGRDSVTLLHLLRFAARELPLDLVAAHFDHTMRPGSEADARWVAGLCRAWEVPLDQGRSPRALAGEAAARRARHAFLRRTARARGARFIALGHHADDQAETVLFRALRGTGIAGLGGMHPLSPRGVLRPLLPFWRSELEAYAGRVGLAWREDPTNAAPHAARNRIRHHLLPLAEREVAPGARRALVELASLAREDELAWSRVIRRLRGRVVRREGAAYVLARARLRGYDSAIGARILRGVLRRFGVVLGRSGTRSALQFITDAPSGRERQLPRGVRLRTEFDTVRVERVGSREPDLPVVLPLPTPGERVGGAGRIGGLGFRATARLAPGSHADVRETRVVLPLAGLHFPLTVRGREPGDRIRTAGGTKPLRKWLMERRVARSRRDQLRLVVDSAGAVLWVVGLGHAARPDPAPSEGALEITIADDD